MLLTALCQVLDLARGLCSCADLCFGTLLRRRHRLHVCATRKRQSTPQRGHSGLQRRPANRQSRAEEGSKSSDSDHTMTTPAAVKRARKVRRHVSFDKRRGRDHRRVDSQNPSSGGAFGGENEASEVDAFSGIKFNAVR